MIKAVLFDLDGTLLNRDASVHSFVEEQYSRLKHKLSHIDKDKYVERFIELDNRGYVWKDKVYQQLVEEFDIPICADELLEDYLQEFKHHCMPFDHLHSMLQQLKTKGLKLGIITNGYGQFQLDNIKALEIENEFESILISEWEGVKKPDPLIFQRALANLGVVAEECLFVGDHPINDVMAAQQVGMTGVWKKDQFGEEQKIEAHYIVNDLLEILKIIDCVQQDASEKTSI